MLPGLCAVRALTLLALFAAPAKAQLYSTNGTAPGAFRLMVQRPDSTGVYSGDFANGTSPDNSTDGVASIQRSFAGQYVPLEVLNVNTTSADGTPASDLTPEQLCEYLKQENPDVTSCEPDFLVRLDAFNATPNDPSWGLQWDMNVTQVQKVWQSGNFGSANVKVCVIDTGVDLTHPDIQWNLWVNQAEKSGKGATFANGFINYRDDDGNGIVDDVYGANFLQGSTDGNVQDENRHGTFVSGVIGGVANNNLGIAGMNQVVRIIPCRFMDATGNGWISDAIRCMDYCIKQGSHIISNSWGGPYSESMQTAVNQATARGVLFVASAGNDGVNTDVVPHYPSTLPDDIVVAVAASDKTGSLWYRSNYGVQTVDLAAPGAQVYNLGLAGSYIYMTGTSMAAPHVSGCAALLLAQYERNGYNISAGLGVQLKRLMLGSTDPLTTSGNQIKNGILNCKKALDRVPSRAAAGTGSGFGAGVVSTQGEIGTFNPDETGGITSNPANDASEISALWDHADTGMAALDSAKSAAPPRGRRLHLRLP